MMSAENKIKMEAKYRLKGKWVESIIAMLTFFFLPMITVLFVLSAYSILGDTDEISEIGDVISLGKVNIIMFVLFHLLAVASMIALSPLYTGFSRLYSKIASGEKIEFSEVFYFFDNKYRYRSSIMFMLGIMVKSALIFIGCELPALMTLIAADGSDSIKYISYALAAIGVIAAFVIVHRFGFSVMLFSYYDFDSRSAVKTGSDIARISVFHLIKLSVSYIPWMLLTFFVVPFLYIFPYMTCAYFVSLKYLITDYRRTHDINSPEIHSYITGNANRSTQINNLEANNFESNNDETNDAEATDIEANISETNDVNQAMQKIRFDLYGDESK